MNHLHTLEQARSYLANLLGTSHDYVIAIDRSIANLKTDNVSPDAEFAGDTDWQAVLCLGEQYVLYHFDNGNGNIPKCYVVEAKEEAYRFYVDLINKSDYYIQDALENAGIFYKDVGIVRTYMWEHTSLLVETIMHNLEA